MREESKVSRCSRGYFGTRLSDISAKDFQVANETTLCRATFRGENSRGRGKLFFAAKGFARRLNRRCAVGRTGFYSVSRFLVLETFAGKTAGGLRNGDSIPSVRNERHCWRCYPPSLLSSSPRLDFPRLARDSPVSWAGLFLETTMPVAAIFDRSHSREACTFSC